MVDEDRPVHCGFSVRPKRVPSKFTSNAVSKEYYRMGPVGFAKVTGSTRCVSRDKKSNSGRKLHFRSRKRAVHFRTQVRRSSEKPQQAYLSHNRQCSKHKNTGRRHRSVHRRLLFQGQTKKKYSRGLENSFKNTSEKSKNLRKHDEAAYLSNGLQAILKKMSEIRQKIQFDTERNIRHDSFYKKQKTSAPSKANNVITKLRRQNQIKATVSGSEEDFLCFTDLNKKRVKKFNFVKIVKKLQKAGNNYNLDIANICFMKDKKYHLDLPDPNSKDFINYNRLHVSRISRSQSKIQLKKMLWSTSYMLK